MKIVSLKPYMAALLLSLCSLTYAEEFLVSQEHKAFSESELVVTLGDSVKFTNKDPFFHNIFSLSDTATFDLGSFQQGESRVITFDKPGKVEIECAIHTGMKMKIEITK